MLITAVFGHSEKELEVSIFAPQVPFFGLQLSNSVIYSWVVIAAVTLLSLLFRFLAVPNFKQVPGTLQSMMEGAVEAARSYTRGKVHGVSDALCCYIVTVVVFLVGCASMELFGLRAPTADITVTFALALITFILINYYGVKVKGAGGRVKSFMKPSPIMFPIKLITEIAVPVSLACRLFGNMLGGLIVMDLLYVAMGNFAVGAPAILGLYFNVFHPLIQAYIFVTLTLTFISEAVE